MDLSPLSVEGALVYLVVLYLSSSRFDTNKRIIAKSTYPPCFVQSMSPRAPYYADNEKSTK